MKGRTADRVAFVLLCASLLVAAACRRPATEAEDAKIRHDLLAVEALKALEAGRPADAIPLLVEQAALAPESPHPRYNLACAQARAGRTDDALASLARAVDAGWTSAEHARQDADLESLRGHAGFEALLARMDAAAAEERAFWSAPRYTPPAPGSAPAFESWAALERHYQVQDAQLERELWKRSSLAQARAERALRNEQIAAIEEYLAAHPRAADREPAARGLVAAILGLREFYPWEQRSAGETDAVLAAADRYDAAFPDGPSRAAVAYDRALARWFARIPPPPPASPSPAPGGPVVRLATPEQFARSDADFAAVAALAPGTSEAGKAAVMRLLLAAWAAGGDGAAVTPEMRARHAELAPLLDDPEVKRLAREHASDVLFLFKDLSALRGTDLAGRTWDLAAMRGKVTLIDFWATWCGPCVAQFPDLKRLHADFGGKGFQIVGISLDGDDRAAFEAWLKKNGADWPQIYDGKGWETPLAQEFGVRAIPFTVLLDRQGRILAIDPEPDRVRELLAREFGQGGGAKGPA